jgi:hypothetical protein
MARERPPISAHPRQPCRSLRFGVPGASVSGQQQARTSPLAAQSYAFRTSTWPNDHITSVCLARRLGDLGKVPLEFRPRESAGRSRRSWAQLPMLRTGRLAPRRGWHRRALPSSDEAKPSRGGHPTGETAELRRSSWGLGSALVEESQRAAQPRRLKCCRGRQPPAHRAAMASALSSTSTTSFCRCVWHGRGAISSWSCL